MAFVHSLSSRVLINEDHLSAQISGYTVTHSREMSTVTALTDTGYKSIPGIASGSVAIRGYFDAAAGGMYEEVIANIGTDNSLLVTVFPDGYTLGQPALMAITDPTGFEIPSSVSEAVTMTIDAMPDDGVDMGVSLHALSAETADSNGSSIDNTAASTGGSVANLHLTAYSGLTNIIVKVQSSTDNSSWSDFITFTTLTAVGSERKTTTGTVPRYIRCLWDVTGTGSATFTVAFARR